MRVPIFPISRTFKNAALRAVVVLVLSLYCNGDKKFFKKRILTLVVVLASGDTDVAGFQVPFRIRAGIWTEIKVFSQDVTFGKVIATAKEKAWVKESTVKVEAWKKKRYWLAGKNFLGLGTEAIDAPSRHTLVIADGDGEAAVISTRDFDDFAGIEAFQMQTCPLAGESRFLPWVFIWVSICKDRVIESFAWCASAPFFLYQRVCVQEENCSFLSWHTTAVEADAFSFLLAQQDTKSFDI